MSNNQFHHLSDNALAQYLQGIRDELRSRRVGSAAERKAERAAKYERVMNAFVQNPRVQQLLDEFSINRTTLSSYRKRWKASGRSAPKAIYPRGTDRKAVMARRQVMPVIDEYTRVFNLKKTGQKFGITGERVRQILRKFERKTGQKLPEKPRHQPVRVEWACDFCGTAYSQSPSVAKNRRCGVCSRIRGQKRKDGKLSDPLVIERLIEDRKAGASWLSMAIAHGIPRNACHCVPSSIWRHLRWERRMDEVPAIWRGASTRWLEKRWPTANPHANSR